MGGTVRSSDLYLWRGVVPQEWRGADRCSAAVRVGGGDARVPVTVGGV